MVPKVGQDQSVIEATNFIPLPENINEPLNMRDESREVLPSAEEAGFAETHDAEGSIPEGRKQQAGPSMDIDVIDENNLDLRELMPALARDAWKEMIEMNAEILEVVQALGGTSSQYKRERQKGIKAVVSEIYSSPGSRRRSPGVEDHPRLRVGLHDGGYRRQAPGLRFEDYER